MKSFIQAVWIALGLAVGLLTLDARAQVQIGICQGNNGIAFALRSDLVNIPLNAPAPAFQLIRDPTGITFAYVPFPGQLQRLPQFIDWNGIIVQVTPTGLVAIGRCQLVQPLRILFPPWPVPEYRPPAPGWQVMAPPEVSTEGPAIPSQFVDQSQAWQRPFSATPEQAQECMENSGQDPNGFATCMLNSMMTPDQRRVYDCYSGSGGDQVQFALCAIGTRVGGDERKALDVAQACYREHGTDWNEYPMCAVEKGASGDLAKIVHCAQEDARNNGGSPTFWGTTACYGLSSLHLTPEQQIVAQCAMTTGGQVYAFAACAGGQMTARELNKCFTDGIGGNGCFGPNNEIVKAVRGIGRTLGTMAGPNGEVVRAWNTVANDIQHGPGPNNDIVRNLNNVRTDLQNRGIGPNNEISKAIRTVIPGFKGFKL